MPRSDLDPPRTRPEPRSRLDTGRVVAVLIAYVGLVLLWQVADTGSGPLSTLFANLVFVPIGIAACVLGTRAAREPAIDRATRRAWGLLTAAFACFLAGDLVWVLYENILGIEPFPSAADAFYLAFYPLMLAGFLSFPTQREAAGGRLKFWLDAGTVLLAGWMLVWYFVIGPATHNGASSWLESALSIAYPVGDLLMLFGVTAVLLRRPAAASRHSLVVLAFGAFVFVIADTAFGWLDANDAYISGSWPDMLWLLAQASFVFATVLQLAGARDRCARSLEDLGSRISALPYAAVAGGYAMLLVVARRQTAYPVGGLLLAAVGVTALVLVRQMTVLRENSRLVRQLHELATTDGLTGVRTRGSFDELASRAFEDMRARSLPFAAIVIDVDRFKEINDTFGHEAGDDVLRHVGEVCRREVRAADLIGRMGGDEFVLLLNGSGIEDAEHVAHRIRRRFEAEPARAADANLRCTLSLGVASGEGCGSLAELVRRADDALYEAKAGGRNRFHVIRSA